MTRRTVRLAAVAALAVLAFPLAGCQTHYGTAAYVGDTRITEDEVDKQVEAFFADKFWGKQVKRSDSKVVRQRTMRALVLREVVRQAEENEKIDFPKAAIETLTKQYEQNPQGIPQEFAGAPSPLIAEIFAGVAAIQKKLEAESPNPQEAQAKIAAALQKALKDAPVQLNPRYGQFSADSFGIVQRTDAGVRDLPVEEPPQPAGGEGEQPPPPPN